MRNGHCLAGHLHSHSTANKQSKAEDRPVSQDISMLSPELQQQWHVDRNMHLGAIKVKPRSAVKAVWKCNNCPAKQQHVWTAHVGNRTRGDRCTYCSNRLVCLHNSLAAVAPDVAGTTARARKLQSRCWVAATSGLSGSAQLASGNGKHLSKIVSVQRPVAPNAVGRSGSPSHSSPLLKLSLLS